MKRPLKIKEVAFILLPVLGLGTFAWYQQRTEQGGKPTREKGRSDGIFVSSIEVHPANGRFQAQGLSHELKATIDHSSPRPTWWGSWNIITNVDPLLDVRQQVKKWRGQPQRYLAYGAVLTTTSIKNGKPTLKVQWRDNRIGAPFINSQLIVSHEIALDKIPTSVGEVTFRGLYLIAGREPLRITRVVRKAGQVSRQPIDRNPHGRLISVKAGAFEQTTTSPANTKADQSQLDFVVSRDVPGKEKVRVFIEDIELHDAKDKIYKPYSTPGFTNSWGGPSNENSDLDVSDPAIYLELTSTLKTTNPLFVKGKVSIDDGWPIPFSVRLPNR